jgi:hypothetical protein
LIVQSTAKLTFADAGSAEPRLRPPQQRGRASAAVGGAQRGRQARAADPVAAAVVAEQRSVPIGARPRAVSTRGQRDHSRAGHDHRARLSAERTEVGGDGVVGRDHPPRRDRCRHRADLAREPGEARGHDAQAGARQGA